MALPHGEGYELALNLLDADRVGAAAVSAQLQVSRGGGAPLLSHEETDRFENTGAWVSDRKELRRWQGST